MERRKFLKLLSGFSVLVIATYAVIPSFHKTIKNILIEASQNINIDLGVIDNFMEEASVEYYWEEFNFKQRILIVLHFSIDNSLFHLPLIDKYQLFTNRIVSQFLLSTDFFSYKMDTNRKITYISFYNPFKTPCQNPFTSLYYSI